MIEFTYAYFNDNAGFSRHLDGSMTFEELRETSKYLFFSCLDDLFADLGRYREELEEPPHPDPERARQRAGVQGAQRRRLPGLHLRFLRYYELETCVGSFRPTDEIQEKIKAWGRAFDCTINHLFGYES